MFEENRLPDNTDENDRRTRMFLPEIADAELGAWLLQTQDKTGVCEPRANFLKKSAHKLSYSIDRRTRMFLPENADVLIGYPQATGERGCFYRRSRMNLTGERGCHIPENADAIEAESQYWRGFQKR